MARPATVPSWATDATITVGDEVGMSTRLEPASGVKAQGNVKGQGAPARWYNWLFGLICDWLAYLANLPSESSFLSATFNWNGQHTFNGANAVQATDDIAMTSNIPRVKLLNLDDGCPVSPAAGPWRQLENGEWTVENPGEILHFPIPVPSGCIVTRVRVGYTGNDAGARVALTARTRDRTLPFSAPTIVDEWQTLSPIASGSSIVDSGALSVTAAELKELSLQVESSLSAFAPGDADYVRWVEITYEQTRVGARV